MSVYQLNLFDYENALKYYMISLNYHNKYLGEGCKSVKLTILVVKNCIRWINNKNIF